MAKSQKRTRTTEATKAKTPTQEPPSSADRKSASKLLRQHEQGEQVVEETTPCEAIDEPGSGGDTTETQDEGDRLQLDKASGFMRDVVAYLKNQTVETRITTVLVARLLICDVQGVLQHMGLYDGLIGDDVLADWRDEVHDILASYDTCSPAAHADAAMAGLATGLEAVTG